MSIKNEGLFGKILFSNKERFVKKDSYLQLFLTTCERTLCFSFEEVCIKTVDETAINEVKEKWSGGYVYFTTNINKNQFLFKHLIGSYRL